MARARHAQVPNLTRKKPKQKQEKLPDAFGLTKSFTKVEDDALDVQKEPKSSGEFRLERPSRCGATRQSSVGDLK